MRLNHGRVIPGRGCVCGVVGRCLSGLLTRRRVRKQCVSGISLGNWTVEGDSPVRENMLSLL
jgi:hypothetical protein